MSTNPAPKDRYVSRGGNKLRGALDTFALSVQDKTCLDVGSSHGGFTDCLLQAGARAVWCIDVGYGLLDYQLRKDPRVHLLERTNFRFFDPQLLKSDPPALAVVDVAFISLKSILPTLYQSLASGNVALVLVKPQFEGTPKEAPGGVVKEESIRQLILGRVRVFTERLGFIIINSVDSTVKGRSGNQETFFYLERQAVIPV